MSGQNFRLLKPENPWIDGLKSIGLILSLTFGIRIALAQCYFIPSASMKPTLEINDRFIVDKISYHFTNPRRGDIVVFTPPEAVVKAENSHDPFIKRVIGLPGEQIEIKGGRVYINNLPLLEDYVVDRPKYSWGPALVPANSYLVLGDNRNRSYDSHSWGFVTRDRLIGRAWLRFWPLNRVAGFSGVDLNAGKNVKV